MLKLIKRPNCKHCEHVEEFLKTRVDLSDKIDREVLETKVLDSKYKNYNNQAPIFFNRLFFCER